MAQTKEMNITVFVSYVDFTGQNVIMMSHEMKSKTGFVSHSFLLIKALRVCKKIIRDWLAEKDLTFDILLDHNKRNV